MPKIPESVDEVKTLESAERQAEMDAIALYGSSQAFPDVAGSYLEEMSSEHEQPSEPRPSSPPG